MKKRKLILKKDHALVPLANSDEFAIIDLEDVYFVSQWNWHRSHSTIMGERKTKEGGRVIISLSRILDKTPKGFFTYFIDGNNLNHRKLNLGTATPSERISKSKKSKINTSGHKGITLEKRSGNWVARITVCGERIHLGTFTDIEDAANAYNQATKKYCGKFSYLNFNKVQRPCQSLRSGV